MIDQNPNIYLFNPTCEYAVANQNANWQPNRILQKMESDLSSLSMFFGSKNDFVLVDTLPSPEFIASLKQLKIDIPNFVLKNESLQNQQFINSPKNKLLPWGWSPASHKFLAPLKKSCSSEFQHSPVLNWLPEHREITSRKFALEVLTQLQVTVKNVFILPAEKKPKICTTQNDFEDAIKLWEKVMIKAPWSSSGRGLQPITKAPVHPKVWEKVLGIVKEQGYALVEPLLKKALDLALLFEIKKGKVEHLGNSYFYTNSKGQYEGNYLNGFPDTIDKAILDFADFMVGEIRQPLINAIENSKMATFYEGYFGVDTLVYFDKNKLKINPCLEINVRYTMGLLALRLEKLISKNKKGIFSTYFIPGKTFSDFKNEMEVQHPLKIVDNKIESGFFILTEARTDSLFGAYILV
ncbi:MAG: hypothetical protein IPF54_10750 [Draconibacterium sp.]|nr:hypothetical protein [Draconibacterium sp.]